MNTNRIVFLDYLRILAFTLVVIGHQFNKDLHILSSDPHTHITLRTLYSVIADASFGGVMGVVLFFLISGYIITHVLQKEAPIEFLIKRFFRIYPLYIVTVLLELAYNYHQGNGLPGIGIIISRMLLIGDFFDTPLALGQVEWTLRIEVMFYLLMCAFRSTGIVINGSLTTVAMLVIVSLLYFTGPLPISNNFHNGYINIFMPFLFIGVVIYYLERRMMNASFAVLSILYLFYTHLSMAEAFTPTWIRFNYSITGVAIFILSLKMKNSFGVTIWSSFLSELTYSVYLMHKWIWELLSSVVSNLKIPFIPLYLQVICLLIIACYILQVSVERNGIKLGKVLTYRLRSNDKN